MKKLRENPDYSLLAIETSCDETAAAVLRGGEVLSAPISSQIEIHRRFGGVVPEIASRNHILAIDNLVGESLRLAKVKKEDLKAVAVTYGAGLPGALLVGVSYAKAYAYALDVPLIPVDHIKGHVFANLIEHPDLKTPFLCLLASGGHTAILEVNSYSDVKILGQTVDDAAGEAFDKAARFLGFPYPGGPEIEKAAKNGRDAVSLPRPFKGARHYNFSYSGIKTAVINCVRAAERRGETVNKADVAFSFQETAVNMLVDNVVRAAEESGYKSVALAGGVGANSRLRERLRTECETRGIELRLPSKSLCTDNAAMIGVAARRYVEEGLPPADLTLDAAPGI